MGNDTFISPVLVRPIAEKTLDQGARPFLTDTNTLYGGSRCNAVVHLQTAEKHGFGSSVAAEPVIIADGLQGDSFLEVSIREGILGRPRLPLRWTPPRA